MASGFLPAEDVAVAAPVTKLVNKHAASSNRSCGVDVVVMKVLKLIKIEQKSENERVFIGCLLDEYVKMA